MTRKILVVGGGPAAVHAAIGAKSCDATADVVILMEEMCEPYEKPPLSKAVLVGLSEPADAPIAGRDTLSGRGILARRGAHCTAIDRSARQVITTDGPLTYDALILATGAVVREISLLPGGMSGVHYLRTEADARAIRQGLGNCRHLVVIGAGLIGLEVAASAVTLGVDVSVIDSAPRIMARACDEDTSAYIMAEHERHGVQFSLFTSVVAVTPRPDRSVALQLSSGRILEADLVVVGTGVKPREELAVRAGLPVRDGILVDGQCRTADPAIFAAGDCTRFPASTGLVRLENWKHAMEQGAIAGRNAVGATETYRPTPSFWTEQYDLYVQGVGWPDTTSHRVRRPLQGKSSLTIETKNGAVNYALGINAQKDLAIIRRLIERKIAVDPAGLADPAQPLAAMLKAKP
jgi:NADPH-dependent 2,4-dienoyl-CoA reductase/sulfur reductase-like enzyme